MDPESPQTPQRPRENRQSPERDQLANFLAVALALVFGGSFIVFLILVTFNVFLGVLAVAAVIGVWIGLHYLVWGRHLPPRDSND